MNVTLRQAAATILLLLSIVFTATAQQKRPAPAKPLPRPVAAPTPAPTFDTLIPADSYNIYGEVRGAGQLIRSNAMTELLEPILKLAGPPKEFKSVVKWLNAHADEVMTSRLLVATWPTAKQVPDTIVAIEFASAEEAAKFATPLNEFLPTVLPTPAPETPEEAAKETDKPAQTEKPKPTEPAKPNFHLQRFGSLILITPGPVTLKQLKPAGSKPLAEDVNFRAARNRFNSEPIFVFIDIKATEREEEERRKSYEKLEKEAAQKKSEAAAEEEPEKDERSDAFTLTEEVKNVAGAELLSVQGESSSGPVKESPPPDQMSNALSALASSFFSGESDWPDAIGLALSFDGDSFDLRALMVNPAGEKTDSVPFMPMLIPGAAYVPEAPNILPADSELFATMSLDLSQIYAAMSKPIPNSEVITSRGNVRTVTVVEHEPPFAAIEKQLKIKIKDDLLPLLGSEVALRLPIKNMNILGLPGPPGPRATDSAAKENSTGEQESANMGPVVAISLRDKDGMRALMPKLIEALGFKGASSLAQTERREDTEIVSYANMFAYAFVGNFLVLSGDPATTRYVVDSYLKHETLATDIQFKTSSRWQPRQLHGQLYISAALMESYKTWAEQPTTRLGDQTRAFLTRLSAFPQPITYSLSNEGLGPLHELHIPKNLVLMAAAGISGEVNPPPMVQNERMAISVLYTIAAAEEQYKNDKGAGSLGTLEQLIAADLVSKEMIESSGYRFDVTVSGDKFEVTAVPVEYGKTGSMSYFIDQSRVLRGADRSGAPASVADSPIH
jgi:hypothetical protein